MADTDLETHEPLQSPGAMLADDMYGKPEPEPEPVKEDPEVEPEVEAEVETEVESEAETDEVEVQTLEQLAEHLETDPEWLRNLKVTEKVNGKEIEVSLSDALATHRKVAAGDDYLADAKSKAKEVLQSTAAEKELVMAGAATLAALLKEAEAAVDTGMSEADWARLRRDDPAEWSAKQKEREDKMARINAIRDKARAEYSGYEEKIAQRTDAEREASLPKEREIFLNLVPEWKDEEVATRESAEMNEYMVSHGFAQEEIKEAAYNGKYLAIVRSAMMYERSKNKVDAAKKKVANIPKVLKPGNQSKESKPTTDSDDRVSILYGQ